MEAYPETHVRKLYTATLITKQGTKIVSEPSEDFEITKGGLNFGSTSEKVSPINIFNLRIKISEDSYYYFDKDNVDVFGVEGKETPVVGSQWINKNNNSMFYIERILEDQVHLVARPGASMFTTYSFESLFATFTPFIEDQGSN